MSVIVVIVVGGNSFAYLYNKPMNGLCRTNFLLRYRVFFSQYTAFSTWALSSNERYVINRLLLASVKNDIRIYI